MLSEGMISPRNNHLGNGIDSNRSIKPNKQGAVLSDKKINQEFED